ncbi:MAG: PEP-CTERM sorting domain-containing protein [Phycisphaerae bacterium]
MTNRFEQLYFTLESKMGVNQPRPKNLHVRKKIAGLVCGEPSSVRLMDSLTRSIREREEHFMVSHLSSMSRGIAIAVIATVAASAAMVSSAQATPTVVVQGVSASTGSNWLTNGLGQIGTTEEAVDWQVAGDLGFTFLRPSHPANYAQAKLSSGTVQFFSAGSGLATTSQSFGLSRNLGWGNTSSVMSLLGTNNLLISEVAPAAGTYYLSVGSGGYTPSATAGQYSGTTPTGNTDSNGITATAGQVVQWIITNPTASDVYWFNASNSGLSTTVNTFTSDAVGPIGFSAVPAPATLSLFAVGAIGLLVGRRKKTKSL